MAEDTAKEVEQEEPQQGNSILSNLVEHGITSKICYKWQKETW